MLELSLFAAQALLAFALGAGAFWARRWFGLAPMYLTFGAIEGFKHFALPGILVLLPSFGLVAPASAIFYVLSLTLVLLVYVREGLAPARQLIWAMLYVSIVMAVLTYFVHKMALLPSTVNHFNLSADMYGNLSWRMFNGSVLLFFGVLLTIVLFNGFAAWTWLGPQRNTFFLRACLSLCLVIALDTVLYDIGNSGWQSLLQSEFLSNLFGKVMMGAMYAGLTTLYLRYFEDIGQIDRHVGHARTPVAGNFALFSALTYRSRIADLENELQRDALTGAFNRRYLNFALAEQLALDQRRGVPTALIMLDLDHFKRINDRIGHLAGDEVLVHVVAIINSAIRRSDSLVRYGGEEFVVILPNTSMPEATQLGERICEAIAHTPILHSGHRIDVTVSVGVAESSIDGDLPKRLIERADARMYEGKRAGRNRVVSSAISEHV